MSMKLLHIIGTLDQSYGGPVEALIQLTSALEKLGHSNEVVSLDVNHHSNKMDLVNAVHYLGPSYGNYKYNSRLFPWIKRNVSRFDAVIVRGIWQYHSFATWRAAQIIEFPYFVFTHGALDPWFKISYPLKHLKKILYWPWAEYRVLRDATGVLFTSEDEKNLASKSFSMYKANEIVVDYGTSAPKGIPNIQKEKFLLSYPVLRGKRFILFLSRIHQKKGIDILIDGFSEVLIKYPDLMLVIAGPDQDGIQYELEKRAKKLGLNKQIIWTGMLKGEMKWGAFNAADVFILPSFSENFGIVVVEALSCGLPVLTTNKVNIWREIEIDNAGIIDQASKSGVINLLKLWLNFSDEYQNSMRINAKNSFLARYDMKIVSKKFIKTLQNYSSE
jgi:glycosyltransferase involved in cell wall biosynthesis